MKIYTKKGDGGQTGLIGGARVSKGDALIAVLGDLDELNACLGLCVVYGEGSKTHGLLNQLQKTVFSVGAEVAAPEDRRHEYLAKGLGELTLALEDWIDRHSAQMPDLTSFVLPGGTILSAHLHQARAVCRRAERSLVGIGGHRAELLVFINRFSDWLFCAARYANHESDVEDVLWHGQE